MCLPLVGRGVRGNVGGTCSTVEYEGGGEASGEPNVALFWNASAGGGAGSLFDEAAGGGRVSDESSIHT
jgi:hypothetical protein